MDPKIIIPNWPAPPGVRALTTTRVGGFSQGAFAGWNLGAHSGDDWETVKTNRALLAQFGVPSPTWLHQVHAQQVVYLPGNTQPSADAAWTDQIGVSCAVLTADCLPVLFCSQDGSRIAAAHAGWRGLAAGVLESTLHALGVAPHRVLAWLGPAIGPQAFEVGAEVYAAFVTHDRAAASALVPNRPGHWYANLYLLARQRLAACGVHQVYGGDFCTLSDTQRFFSYRRDGQTGRMACVIWRV